jgi:double zinc ribbon protein
VTDLERFFVQLARNLAAIDRSRLAKPLILVDIRNSILPYRANRRALALESSEDYELVLMRFCAGEGGFARTGPDEVRDEFVKELASPNPDLTLVQRHENAVIHLDPEAVAKALDQTPELAFAPPDQRYAPKPPAAEPPSRPARAVSRRESGETRAGRPAAICGSCGEKLPPGRKAKFCPHCGQGQALTHCPECQADLDPSWRHCVNCGAALQSS